MTTVSTSVQGSAPPRVLVTVEGLVAADAVSITIFREVAGERTVLRGADGEATDGNDAFVRTDSELPFGVPVTWVAEVVDSVGDIAETESTPITVNTAGVWLSDAVSGLAAPVIIAAWPPKPRARRSTTFVAGGRNIVVSGPRTGTEFAPQFLTLTEEDRDALDDLLSGATSGVIQIRNGEGITGVDSYVAVLSDTEERDNDTEALRLWVLNVIETDAWPTALAALGFTLLDLSNSYTTLLDISTAYDTLLEIAQADLS